MRIDLNFGEAVSRTTVMVATEPPMQGRRGPVTQIALDVHGRITLTPTEARTLAQALLAAVAIATE